MSEPYYISRGEHSAEVRTWRNLLVARSERQELSDNIVGVTANVDDLNTKIYQNKAVADDRLDDMNNNMRAREADLDAKVTNCTLNSEEQLRENTLQMYQAQKRVDRILWVGFFAILWLMLGWGWLGYEEAIAGQARADAETARVENFKKKWFVKAWFLRDWAVTVCLRHFFL